MRAVGLDIKVAEKAVWAGEFVNHLAAFVKRAYRYRLQILITHVVKTPAGSYLMTGDFLGLEGLGIIQYMDYVFP
jgi:hypothetical protein